MFLGSLGLSDMVLMDVVVPPFTRFTVDMVVVPRVCVLYGCLARCFL